MTMSAALRLLLLLAASASAGPAWEPDPKWASTQPAPDYRVTEDDFRVFERGLRDAEKVAASLFPRGIVGIDAVLYDARDLYVYSRSGSYRLPKFRRRAGYQVYRVPLGYPVTRHEMARCAAHPGPASVDVLRTVTERAYACAPWGTFGAIQKIRRSDYRFVEGYWASMIHEYGHQYRDKLSADPTPEMAEIDAIVAKMGLMPGVDRARAADEGYATWCELAGSRGLYPAHFRRLMTRAARAVKKDDVHGHEAGLRAAAELIRRGKVRP